MSGVDGLDVLLALTIARYFLYTVTGQSCNGVFHGVVVMNSWVQFASSEHRCVSVALMHCALVL